MATAGAAGESLFAAGVARRRERRVTLACAAMTGMAFIDATALNVALPAIARDLGASGTQLLWVVNAYGLVVAALLLPGGAAGDRLGRRRVGLWGIGIFCGASLACGASPDIRTLIAARAIQGCGAALMIPAALALLTANVEPARRGRAVGAWTAATVIASALGPVLGGLLAHVGFWRGVFLINAPLGAAAARGLARWAAESRDDEAGGPIDWRGALCAAVALGAFNAGLMELATPGRRGPESTGGAAIVAGDAVAGSMPAESIGRAGALCVIGIAAGAAFAVRRRRAADPLAPRGMFGSRSLAAACVTTLLVYSALYGMTLLAMLNLIEVQQYSPLQAGLAQLPLVLVVTAVSVWAGQRHDRRGPRGLVGFGAALVGAGCLGLAIPGVTAGPGEFWRWYLAPLALVGAGMGLTMAPLSAAIMCGLSDRRAGLASGVNSTLSRLASVAGVAALGAVALGAMQRGANRPPDGSAPSPDAPPAAASGSGDAVAGFLSMAAPPAGVDGEDAAERPARLSFVRGFRIAACVAAAAAWCGAAIAAAMLDDGPIFTGARR